MPAILIRVLEYGRHSWQFRLPLRHPPASRFSWKAFRGDQVVDGYEGPIFDHAPLRAVRAQQHFEVFDSTLIPRIIWDGGENPDKRGDPDGGEDDHRPSTRHSVLPRVARHGLLEIMQPNHQCGAHMISFSVGKHAKTSIAETVLDIEEGV